ncbi:MAG: hypothetical protein ACK4P1_07585, partial [Aggregatilineales bacterium]
MLEVTLSLANNTALDLTPYVRGLRAQQGIQSSVSGMAWIGVCYLRLDNSARHFTPGNVSSPYYGLIVPNQPLSVKINGTTVFTGRLRRLTAESGLYGERSATLECEDLLSALQATKIALPLQEHIRADELIRLVTARAFRTQTCIRPLHHSPSATIAENDTVTIDDVTYRFKETPVQANDVKRLTTPTTPVWELRYKQLEYLMAAINGGQGEGEKYFAGAQRPRSFVADWGAGGGVTGWIRARNPVRYYRLAETSGT